MSEEFLNEFFKIERGVENCEVNEKEILDFMERHLMVILGSEASSDGIGSSNYASSDVTESSTHSLRNEIDKEYLWNLDDWQYIYEWTNKFVENKLEEYFTKGKDSMEEQVEGIVLIMINNSILYFQLREYLQKHLWDQVSDEKIYESFEKLINRIVNVLGSQKFLFGDQPSLADISLFSILVQFFEGHLNIPVLKHFFLKKDEKPERDDNENIGKSIVIEHRKENNNCEIEEEGPSFIEDNGDIEENNKYIDSRIQRLYNYVERMKENIGLGSYRWTNLTKYPWPLNYERTDYMTKLNIAYVAKEINNLSKSFNKTGFFHLETDDMNSFVAQLDKNKWIGIAKTIIHKKSNKWTNIKNIYFGKNQPKNEEIDKHSQLILKEILNYLSTFWPNKDDDERKMYEKIILHSIAAAYCNLGKGKTPEDADKCQKMHENKALELKQFMIDDAEKSAYHQKGGYFKSAPIANTREIKENIEFHVRTCLKLTYDTIQKYNENKIAKNVEEAIIKAWLIKKNEDNKDENKNPRVEDDWTKPNKQA
uniref:GST_C_6 domain-containing protein n=1 Tax=Meloidogyne hapla TaxID=6305 RepID=A0A1I8BK38_MELHA